MRILNHVLDVSNSDMYISKDFFNVQQTAGGATAGRYDGIRSSSLLQAMSAEPVTMIRDWVEVVLMNSLPDDDVRGALLTFDDTIGDIYAF